MVGGSFVLDNRGSNQLVDFDVSMPSQKAEKVNACVAEDNKVLARNLFLHRNEGKTEAKLNYKKIL